MVSNFVNKIVDFLFEDSPLNSAPFRLAAPRRCTIFSKYLLNGIYWQFTNIQTNEEKKLYMK